MKKILFLLVLVNCFNFTYGRNLDTCKHDPVVSHVFWITLHVREAAIYDSIYQLFVTDLQIPQFFDTETWGNKRYFTIRAGNVILEPCGPFEFHESFGQDVMTRYNTLAFRPYESAAISAEKLKKLGFDITVRNKDALLNLSVDELCTDFLPVNVSKTIQMKSKDGAIMDSLTNELIRKDGGPIGLEYIEEVHIGYKTEAFLEKWAMFLDPLEHIDNLWILPQKPNIRFFESEREEIVALVFKVKSLEVAVEYLESKGLRGIKTGDRIEMDISWSNGIRIILTE